MAPSITVTELGKDDGVSFDLQTEWIKDTFSTEFWVDRAGDYQIVVVGSDKTLTKNIAVGQQEFLPFSWEFGFFSLSFALAMIGVILWTRFKMKSAKSKD